MRFGCGVRCSYSIPLQIVLDIGVVDNQATKAESGATAGATLMPIVTSAQIIAAKNDAIWVRAV
jgi:hypothetical protein